MKIYSLTKNLLDMYAKDLLHNQIFQIWPPNLDMNNLGESVMFVSNYGLSNEINVIFGQDHGFGMSCLLGRDMGYSPYINDLFKAINIPLIEPQNDFLIAIKNCSKAIINNLDKIVQAYNKENYNVTMKKIDVLTINKLRDYQVVWKQK